MAVRIYSLAKDLGLDSKELVDLCTRIGIQNKGSALASLEDEEIARIKKHIAEKSAATTAAAAPAAAKPAREPAKEAPVRDAANRFGAAKRDLSVGRRNPALAGVGTGGSESQQSEDERSETEAVEAAKPVTSEIVSAPEPVVAQIQTTEPEVEPEVAEVSAKDAATVDVVEEKPSNEEDPTSPVQDKPQAGQRRDDFYSPTQTSGKVRVLGRPKLGSEGSKPTGDRTDRAKKSREPVLNLAKIPKSSTPSPAPKSQEPATQKPIVKLTPDVIQGVKKGMDKPSEKPQPPDRKSVV